MNCRIVVLLLFMAFGLHNTVHGMSLAQRFAQSMSKLTTYTFFGLAYGHLGHLIHKARLTKNLTQDVDHEVAEFACKTLQTHGYTESFYNDIKFKKSNQFHASHKTMYIPFSYRELQSELNSSSPNTLYKWQNAILHEAGHIDHQDVFTAVLALATYPLIIQYSSKKISNLLRPKMPFFGNASYVARGLATLPCLMVKLSAVNALFFGLRKYQEYRADYNIIKRVTNPEMLEARAQDFNDMYESSQAYNYDKLQSLKLKKLKLVGTPEYEKINREYEELSNEIEFDKKYPWLEELQDVHPRHTVRRDYFAKAAQNLREKQNT